MGKYYEKYRKIMIPMSIQEHHSFVVKTYKEIYDFIFAKKIV